MSNAIHQVPSSRLSELFRYSTATFVKAKWRSNAHLPGVHRGTDKAKSGVREADTRKYRVGDNLRRVKWKQHARRPEAPLRVRIFESQRKIPVVLLVDVTGMDYGTQELSKCEMAAVLLCSALRCADKSSDMAKVIFYSRDKVERSYPARPGELDQPNTMRAKCMRNAIALSCDPRVLASERGTVPGLLEALSKLPASKSLVFILSDFSDFEALADGQRDALRTRSFRHEVVCCKINDLREWNLYDVKPSWGPIAVQPAEGPPRMIYRRGRYEQDFKDRQAVVASEFTELRWKGYTFGTEEERLVVQRRFRRIITGKRGKRGLTLAASTTQTSEGGK
jgi:uncharacterized protein (DUF58 family)